MYFLGLDPSTKCTGYTVMDENKDIIEKGKITMPEGATEGEKIFYQIYKLEKIMNKYELVSILCEDQFSKLNVDTLKKLSRVVGAILCLSSKLNIPIATTYPTSWRKVFHGSGKAKKQDTFHKVVALYGFDDFVFSKDNDITDSVGIAWACVDLYLEKNEGALVESV